ncbi:MAG: hypothetical protein EOS25_14735 [Mesorhizobium sp.]|uniref:hypothetical protein n=1 Tax=Mesorhizobium sp. TaxID=1871066 RepID=UPI000FE87E67|nr:hypothetical protein [Mesorhizobium sp.]RWD48638.1 MAG: hypothetical protein EOS59_16755 [Mesorhizobium sp.]RWE60179.1 MAG: hypothetical protein EOS24_13855 [Mesorhizobium sp.]RWF11632.1 MAG: hypothetical protein EOS69_09375 [Mesorhizobium sp.]RWF18175.1 MAG: hypothetical protein EOS25_14735 [Mesorhizobium sp.]TIX98011.1 MAG: hypothetical protein E5V22_30980 [Mesorhizobium sp.]
MTDLNDFAILAPVPLEHLQSGEDIARRTGFVAFGSRKWELFRKVDDLRVAAPVGVLVYDKVPAKDSFIVCWARWYIGCEESANGKHSQGMTHRPPTTGQYTSDNQGHWAVFWHVRDLRQLPPSQRLPISVIQTIKGGWRKSAPPRGPEQVATPSTIEFQP